MTWPFHYFDDDNRPLQAAPELMLARYAHPNSFSVQ